MTQNVIIIELAVRISAEYGAIKKPDGNFHRVLIRVFQLFSFENRSIFALKPL